MYRYIKVVLVLFSVTLVTLFVQHHVELSESGDKNNIYLYYPPGKTEKNKKTSNEEYRTFLINVRLSDTIPINRKIPDSRPDR